MVLGAAGLANADEYGVDSSLPLAEDADTFVAVELVLEEEDAVEAEVEELEEDVEEP